MQNIYIIGGAVLASFIVGVVFSPGITRLFVLLFTDVKKEYTKLLEETKALYDADTKALRAELDKVHAGWHAEVAQLKSDLGDANNKVKVLTSVIQGATVLQPVQPITPAPAGSGGRTKAQIAADLAATQATEAQLQADLAAATD